MPEDSRIPLMDAEAVRRATARMAREIVESNGGAADLVLMGIHRRGTEISSLLVEEIRKSEGVEVAEGSLDITLYRDDLEMVGPLPIIGQSDLPAGGLDGKSVVIVDDVLFTGRTARAAMNELMDWGRPGRIYLCVLVDRGGRELPIQPDFVGRHVDIITDDQRVEVLVPELDGRLAVDIVSARRETT